MRYEGSAHLVDVPRALLLGAAGEVVREHGYDRLTLSRLVSTAGVSVGMFHSLFDGPEDCFLQAFEEAVLSAEGIARDEYGRTPGVWRVKVRAALGAVLVFLDERPDLRAVLVTDVVKAGPRVAERYARAVRGVARALHESAVAAMAVGEMSGECLTVIDAECAVQGVLSLARSFSSDSEAGPLGARVGELMGVLVLPYEGPVVAERELALPVGVGAGAVERSREGVAVGRRSGERSEVLRALNMRVTYRTVRVLEAIAKLSGGRGEERPCNRRIGALAGVADEGQISKLLRRLQDRGLVEEVSGNVGKRTGLAYEWRLTSLGEELERAARIDTTREDRYRARERRGAHRR